MPGPKSPIEVSPARNQGWVAAGEAPMYCAGFAECGCLRAVPTKVWCDHCCAARDGLPLKKGNLAALSAMQAFGRHCVQHNQISLRRWAYP
jgi:hypothetical protein